MNELLHFSILIINRSAQMNVTSSPSLLKRVYCFDNFPIIEQSIPELQLVLPPLTFIQHLYGEFVRSGLEARPNIKLKILVVPKLTIFH